MAMSAGITLKVRLGKRLRIFSYLAPDYKKAGMVKAKLSIYLDWPEISKINSFWQIN